MYDHAQVCANGFREYCLAYNLLDFSLQLEVFFSYCLAEPMCRTYLFERYRHLIVDNLEEDTPRAHDLLKQWMGECDTALIVMDLAAGSRAFLGADPRGAAEFKWLCQDWVAVERSHVMSPQVEALSRQLVMALGQEVSRTLLSWSPRLPRPAAADAVTALRFEPVRFQPEMFEWVADQVTQLVYREGTSPDEIVILAPYLGDALRFSLSEALSRQGIPLRSHRPSRALRDEPAARCILTLAALAHPAWGQCPAAADVAQALMVAIEGMDLIRARLLAEIVYRPEGGRPVLSSFDQIRTQTQERISFVLGERFERLRRWIDAYAGSPSLELDDWIHFLFTVVLSQPGFGFYRNTDAGRVAANLIESIAKFRRAVGDTLVVETGAESPLPHPLGLEYVRMVERGVIAATYVQSWQIESSNAVLVAPAYTFLMANRPVDVQFWLNIGSAGWWERLYQPLTHPYVLSRNWPEGRLWGDEAEYAARQMALGRLVLGLTRRCRRRIYLGIADLGEQGYEQRGPLLQAVQRVLRQASQA
jgi:hypothetical protein